MIGRRRIKSVHDLSANSIATRTAGRGARRRMDFWRHDFRWEMERRECRWTSLGSLGLVVLVVDVDDDDCCGD